MEGFPMRATLPLSALVLILSLAPASAMCGGMGQQAQASPPGQRSNQGSTPSDTQRSSQGGMMCGRPATSSQAEDPFGMKPSEPQQQSGMGLCPCCRGMAMMGGGMMGGGTKQGDDPHKGMDMSPKQ
jgi:hypothetical protein